MNLVMSMQVRCLLLRRVASLSHTCVSPIRVISNIGISKQGFDPYLHAYIH